MAGTRIVCPIERDNWATHDLTSWPSGLVRRTLEATDQGRFLGGHLLYIIFFFCFFQLCNAEILPISNMN